MASTLRLLLVAEPAAAGRAVESIRRHVEVEAALAPAAEILAAALRDGVWDAVLVVPGSSVADVDVARLVGASGVPLVVVAEAVPAGLAPVAALVLGPAALEGLPFALTSLAASGPADFVAAANAVLAEATDASARSADTLAAGPSATPIPADPPAMPSAPPAETTEPASPYHPGRLTDDFVRDLPIGVYRSTPDGRIVYANPALAQVLHVGSVDELLTLDVRDDLHYPKDTFDAEIRRRGVVRNLVVSWTDRTGQAVCTRENARAVYGPDGAIRYVEGTMEDVTAEVEAQAAERRQARQHEAALRFAEAADLATTAEALFAPAAEALLHATEADFSLLVLHEPPAPGQPADGGRNTVGAVAGRLAAPETDGPRAAAAFESMPVAAQTQLVRDLARGRPPWLPESVVELMHAQGMRSLCCVPLLRCGRPFGALVAGYDTPRTFTDAEQQAAEALAWHLAGHLARHAAEERRRDAEATLRVLSERGPQVLYRLRYTSEGPVFDYLSPVAEALTGYSPEAMAAAGGFAGLIEEREVFAGRGLPRGPVEGETGYHALYRLRSRHAGLRWVENHAALWTTPDGAPLGLVGTFLDVTDRRAAESAATEAARAALDRQAALVDLSRATDAQALALRAAEAACAHTRANAASVWLADGPWMVCQALVAGDGVPDTVVPSYPAEAFETALGRLRGERAFAVDHVEQDPRVDDLGLRPMVEAFGVRAFALAPVRLSGAVVGLVALHESRDAASPPGAWTEAEIEFAAALADAVALGAERAERARAEDELRQSEGRYRVLSDLASDYAFAMRSERDGCETIEWATDAFDRISGFSPQQIQDRGGFRALIHPDSIQAVRDGRAELEADGQTAFTVQIVTAAGEARWVRHVARIGERRPDGSVTVYHAGRDVTERVHAEDELVRAREAAEAVARLKSSFLANMSHEIRTPLTGILGFAELLEADVADEHREYVDCIATAGRRLLDTLNSVLDLARLEAEEVAPERTPVDVAAAAAETVRLLVPLADRKGLDLTVETGDGCTALLDRPSLDRITTNLVGNAVKFTESGGIAVSVLREADRVVLRVADTGIGISEDFMPRLFDEFRQETDGHGRSHEGSGLGLAITRRLTNLLGGRISVESRRPGGTVFTVSFPAEGPPPDASGADPHVGPLVAMSPSSPSHSSTDPARTPMFDFRFGFQTASEPFGDDRLADVSLGPAGPPPLSPAAPSVSVAAEAFAPGAVASAPFQMVSPAVEASAPGAAPAYAFEPAGGDGATYGSPQAVAPPEPSASADPFAPTPPLPSATDTAETTMLVRPARDETSETPEAASDGRPAILVVEDNSDTRMLLERILRGTYDVTAVGDARSALVAMNSRRFRGLVLDINLGGRETGTDVLRVARSLDGYAGVFAIALTAYALPGDRERLLETGFDEYLSKPFSRQSLLDALAGGVRA